MKHYAYFLSDTLRFISYLKYKALMRRLNSVKVRQEIDYENRVIKYYLYGKLVGVKAL